MGTPLSFRRYFDYAMPLRRADDAALMPAPLVYDDAMISPCVDVAAFR